MAGLDRGEIYPASITKIATLETRARNLIDQLNSGTEVKQEQLLALQFEMQNVGIQTTTFSSVLKELGEIIKSIANKIV